MAGPAGLTFLYMPPSSFSAGDLKQALANTTDGMPSSTSVSSSQDYVSYPLVSRHGRTYLRDPDNPYPLPCDLAEIHRQTLRTLIQITVFGKPFCTNRFDEHPPQRVLDLACGSGLWSHKCHEYFARRGHPNVAFTGVDVVNLAPDLQKQGVHWQFKRVDFSKRPDRPRQQLPFPDEYFDFVFIKDVSLCPPGLDMDYRYGPLSEVLRVLKPGGVVEVWDSDHIFRCLLPNPPSAPGLEQGSHDQATATGTFTISAATPFAEAQNRYLKDYNAWITKAFEKYNLIALPSSAANMTFTYESERLHHFSSRRVAIPLGEIKWEQKQQETGQRKPLTPDQLAIRQMTLLTVVQMIEGMEPILREASGKGRDEWDRWWTGLITDLMQNGGVATGECLEIGAWWAQKR
ncbi:hypothetical protein VTO42DRAFT_8713 [Malbranchea cinnamomea]